MAAVIGTVDFPMWRTVVYLWLTGVSVDVKPCVLCIESLYRLCSYIRQGRYVMPFLCLSVCLSVSNFMPKLLNGSSRKFHHRCISLDREELVKFWNLFAPGSRKKWKVKNFHITTYHSGYSTTSPPLTGKRPVRTINKSTTILSLADVCGLLTAVVVNFFLLLARVHRCCTAT